jgi:predicted RNA-binding protein with PIN domain
VGSESFLLVDGYNIIYAWDFLKELANESLEDARDRLIDILCDYSGYIDDRVILVFDAHKVKGNPGDIALYNNIHIVYTQETETADHYIEKTIKTIIRDYNVSVATSDKLEQVIILAKGAVRISARELLGRISQAKEEMSNLYILKHVKKENLLFDNLSPEIAEYLEAMRRK